jgi:hypothetical protein
MLRRKREAERKRAEKAAALEAQRDANRQRKYKPPKEFKTLSVRKYHEVFDPSALAVQNLKSKPLDAPKLERKELDERMFDPAWVAREQAAQAETERKKKMVAPMANKMGYQYIGGIEDKDVIRDLGKKV